MAYPQNNVSVETKFYSEGNPKKLSPRGSSRLSSGDIVSNNSLKTSHGSDLHIAEIKCHSSKPIAGFELQFVLKGFEFVDILYGVGSNVSDLHEKEYITQYSKINKKTLTYFNPNKLDAINATAGYYSASNPKSAFWVLLKKTSNDNSFALSPKFKAVTNFIQENNSYALGLEEVSIMSRWSIRDAFGTNAINNSHIRRVGQMSLTDLYDENLDIDSSLQTLDVLDVVGLCNYRWYDRKNRILNSLGAYDNQIRYKRYVPFYINLSAGTEESLNLQSANAELKIKNIEIKESEGFFDLSIDIGFKANVSSHGWQFDIGRNWGSYSFVNNEDNSVIKPNVIFKGQLKDLEEFYDYRTVTIDNRFGYDNITRVSIYRKPFNGKDPSAIVDLSKQNILLNSHGTTPREYLETIIRLEWNNIKKISNLNILPLKNYYLLEDYDSNDENKKIGSKWYGSVNYDPETSSWFTGDYLIPGISKKLELKWDLFEILNRKAISNSSLSFIKHYSRTEQGLKNFSYQFVYPEEGSTAGYNVLEKYDNDYQVYAESVLGYLNSTIMNGLSSGNASRYDSEIVVPSEYVAGYMNDHDLSGTKNIIDTSALSNLFTIRISSNPDEEQEGSMTATAVRNILENRVIPGERSSNNPTYSRPVASAAVERRVLDSLNKIVPTLIIDENNTLTYPQFEPSIIGRHEDASLLFFSEALECNNDTLPGTFRSWKQYFSEMHDIPHHVIPEREDFVFFQVKLSTTSKYAKFLGWVSYALDFSKAKEAGVKLKVSKLNDDTINEFDIEENYISLCSSNDMRNSNPEWTIAIFNEDGNNILEESSETNQRTFEEAHISMYATQNNFVKPLSLAVSANGGPMDLCNIFLYGPDIKDKKELMIHFLQNEVNFYTTTLQTRAVWSDLPVATGQDDVVEHSIDNTGDNNRLFIGPSVTYKNFYLHDNSTSVRKYGEIDVFLQAENSKDFIVSTLSAVPYHSGSFTIALSGFNHNEISSFEPIGLKDYNYTKHDEGIQKWNFSFLSEDISETVSGSISGFREIGKISFKEEVLQNEILDLDPNVEIIYPPIGVDKTLRAPSIDENYIYPTWENCFFYADSSDKNYFEISGSEVEKMSNLFSSNYIDKPVGFEGPLRDKQLTFGKDLSTTRFIPEKLLNGSWDYYLDHNNPIDLSFNLNLGETVNSIKEQFRPQFTNNRIVDFTFFKYDTDGEYNNELVSNILKVHLGYEKTDCSYYDPDFHVLDPNDQNRNQRYYPLRDVAGVASKILTEADIEAGYVVDENTRYISNYYIESNGNATYLTLSEIENKLEGEKNSISPDYGFPYYHFTVNKDGDLFIKSDYPAELETYLARDNSQGGWLDNIFNALYDLVIIESANDGIKDNSYSKRFAFWWNSKHFDGFRVKDDNGSEVYLRDENGKILGDTRRWYLEIKAQSTILHPDIAGDPTNTINLYFPSQYEKLNQEFFSDTERVLDGNLFSFNFNISEITSSVRMWINGNEVISSGELWFPESFQSTASPYPTIQVGNVFQTSGLKRLSINMGTLQDGYTVYYPNDHELNSESFFFDKTEYSFGEILASNYDFTDKERDLLVATIMGKWGFEDLMNPNNIFYGEKTSTLWASFTNESMHPDKLAIDANRNYSRTKNFRTDSTRFSSKSLERRLQILRADFETLEGEVLDTVYFNERPTPEGFELTPEEETKIYISKWDEESGLLELSYRSNKKIDAFQVELGNFINNPEEYVLSENGTGVGIVDTYSSELMNQYGWTTPPTIGKGPGNYPHEKVNKIAYAYSPGPEDTTGWKEGRVLGTNPLPATTRGRDMHLFTIKVDKDAFKGTPTIERFSIVSNDLITSAPTDFGTSFMNEEEILGKLDNLVKSGYYDIDSPITEISDTAEIYNSPVSSETDGLDPGYIDVKDYISVRNYLALNTSAPSENRDFVPYIFTSSRSEFPDYNFSVVISSPLEPSNTDDDDGIHAILSWGPVNSEENLADSFTIFRRSFNINNQSQPSGVWVRLIDLDSSVTHWNDLNPPINETARKKKDNPEFEYLLLAKNKYGTSSFNSDTFQFEPYFSGELIVEPININTTKGTEVMMRPKFFDSNSAAPPHGTNTIDPDQFNVIYDPPDKNVGKFLSPSIITRSGARSQSTIFHFNMESSNFVGKLSGKYTVQNTSTGEWAESTYTINVLPNKFDLSHVQTKIVDGYSNTFYFDIQDVGTIDWVTLQRSRDEIQWDRVGEWIKTKDLSQGTIRLEDKLKIGDIDTDNTVIDFGQDQTFYYRVLAYEDLDNDQLVDQGDDFEIFSSVYQVSHASRNQVVIPENWIITNVDACSNENSEVSFDITPLAGAISYSVATSNDQNEEFKLFNIYHDTGLAIGVLFAENKRYGCNGVFDKYFKITVLSNDLITTEYDFSVQIDKCPSTPIAKNVTLKVCLNEEIQGDLKTYLSNASEDVLLASFAEVGSLLGLVLNVDGTFSYTPTSVGSVSFDYTGTSCGVTSNTGTITFEVSDECVLCPDDQEEVICRYAKVNQEYPEFAGHTPLKYKDRNVSNIRLRELQEDYYKVSSNKS